MAATAAATSTTTSHSNNKKNDSPSTLRGMPTIYSLSSFQVQVADEVYTLLKNQYPDNNHWHRILEYMKLPPRQTVLRLTTTKKTKTHPSDDAAADDDDDVAAAVDDERQTQITKLREHVLAWLQQESSLSGAAEGTLVRGIVKGHDILDDVITIDLVPAGITTTEQEEEEQLKIDATSDNDESLFACTIPRHYREQTTKQEYPIPFINATQRQEKGWPLTHRAVLVDRLCGEAVLRGADIFVRGVLGADMGIRRNESVAVYADLQRPGAPGISRGLVVHEYYTGDCLFLGVGRTHCSRAEFFSQSKGIAVRMSALPYERAGPVLPPLDDWLAKMGSLFAQNLPSLVVGHALAPQPGEIIYDMCGAPGGKTLHVARLTNFQATICMSDKSRRKVLTAKQLFQSMLPQSNGDDDVGSASSCIVPLHMDGTASCVVEGDQQAKDQCKSVLQLIASASVDQDGLLKIDKFFPESFDRILLDPPCSALGLRPKLRVGQTTAKELLSFAHYQQRFISQAVALLKPGGTLVYSTCTIHAAENEGMVKYILYQYPKMNLVSVEPPAIAALGGPGLPNQGLTKEQCAKVLRFDPTAADTMGFFLAKFSKSLKTL